MDGPYVNDINTKTLFSAVAYLGFEIAGANKKNSPVFLKDRFLYTVSYKPILSVIDLDKYTYPFFRTK